MLDHTWVLSPNIVFEHHFVYAHQESNLTSPSPLNSQVGTLTGGPGFVGVNGDGPRLQTVQKANLDPRVGFRLPHGRGDRHSRRLRRLPRASGRSGQCLRRIRRRHQLEPRAGQRCHAAIQPDQSLPPRNSPSRPEAASASRRCSARISPAFRGIRRSATASSGHSTFSASPPATSSSLSATSGTRVCTSTSRSTITSFPIQPSRSGHGCSRPSPIHSSASSPTVPRRSARPPCSMVSSSVRIRSS